jgi:hypothetical protein
MRTYEHWRGYLKDDRNLLDVELSLNVESFLFWRSLGIGDLQEQKD